MDRSFLSHDAVIEASSDWVCIRLSTYESAEEAEFLKQVFTGRSGELENTTFALLSPDGKRPLVRAGRSPDFAFHGTREQSREDEMAAEMRALYKAQAKRAKPLEALPAEADVRLALNVAACDGRALVVLHAKDRKDRESLAERVAAVAWKHDLAGRLRFVVADDAKELAAVKGAREGLLVVAPDTFGVEAQVLSHAGTDADDAAVLEALVKGLEAFDPPAKKDTRRHIQEGRRKGVHWETEIPVTDPGPRGNGPPPDGEGPPPDRR